MAGTGIISEAELGRRLDHYGGIRGAISELGCDSYEAAVELLAKLGTINAINPSYDKARVVGTIQVAKALNVEAVALPQPQTS